MSEKVTGEGAFGPGGGGVFGSSPELYERPERGVGVGCCALVDMKLKSATATTATTLSLTKCLECGLGPHLAQRTSAQSKRTDRPNARLDGGLVSDLT